MEKKSFKNHEFSSRSGSPPKCNQLLLVVHPTHLKISLKFVHNFLSCSSDHKQTHKGNNVISLVDVTILISV